jgi:hypothetical protein
MTIAGTDTTPCRSASEANSLASIAAAETRVDASAHLYASNTAGGQCGQVGVTYTSIATSRSSVARAERDASDRDGWPLPASAIAYTSVESS